MDISEKWKHDRLVFSHVTNTDMVCIDCSYRYEDSEISKNTSTCEMYETKPDSVLLGGECELYEGDSL